MTYNVLSNALCTNGNYPRCALDAIDNEARIQRVWSVIADAVHGVRANNAEPLIVCLQEVSWEWAHVFQDNFAIIGYSIQFYPHHKRNCGFMGNAIAWPDTEFTKHAAYVKCIGDSVKLESPRRTTYRNVFEHMNVVVTLLACAFVFYFAYMLNDMNLIVPTIDVFIVYCISAAYLVMLSLSFLRIVADYVTHLTHIPLLDRVCIGDDSGENGEDVAKLASSRRNCVVSVLLEHHLYKGALVWIHNHHMPCAFKHPRVMAAHLAMAMRHAQKLRIETPSKYHELTSIRGYGGGDYHVPSIFCGDLNITYGNDLLLTAIMSEGIASEKQYKQLVMPGYIRNRGDSDALSRAGVHAGIKYINSKNAKYVEPMLSVYDGYPQMLDHDKFNRDTEPVTCWTISPFSKGDTPFKGILDYILANNDGGTTRFVYGSFGWETGRPEGPLPTIDNPSDHIPVFAYIIFFDQDEQ